MLYVGAITGTSVDGLDLALVDIDIDNDSIRLVSHETRPLPDALRNELIQLGQAKDDRLDRLGLADNALGRFIGQSIAHFLTALNLPEGEPRAIGSHGQTVRHRPGGPSPFTMQIGDPSLIAEISGITTVADFRRRDMAAGGEAAPLVPAFHARIFTSDSERRAVLNIGGISNITALEPLRGFDTGPGNALLDAWCAAHTGRRFDEDGTWASGGRVVSGLLSALLADPFVHRTPPKSTGKEHYNLEWLHALLEPGLQPRDVQRTLVEFTARSAVDARNRWAPSAQRLLVCGGGRLNRFLMQRLAELSGIPVQTTDQHGWDGDAIEAAAFAWLAHRRLVRAPGNVPEVTGARGPRVLGAVYAG